MWLTASKYGGIYQSRLEPLIMLQKRAIRTIAGDRKFEHALPLLQNVKSLNIMKKYHHNPLPSFLFIYIFKNNSFHEYHWRQGNLFSLAWIHSTIVKKNSKNNLRVQL